ncbi:MAG: glycoside hydrolase family 20 [Glaciihabitans sp.]|nr:glycoside hydrolase family 20 [Glaciihabitans sp.]
MSLARLFPQPRTASVIPGAVPTADAPLSTELDSSLPAQGYRLHYAADSLTLAFADAAGLRYGQQALSQLRAITPADQMAVDIEDWPDFERRGFMLDISRDRVPTRASLARLVDVLALARINQLEIYTEHTYAYIGHQLAWQDASPLTAEDVRWLDDLCTANGIELVPNQNTFGHWERWLAHDVYLPRAENQVGMDFAGQFRAPSTLAPTEDNAVFVTELLEELTPNFRSKRLNIGADETWELGTGVSRARAEELGLGAVYLEYVARVMQPWVDNGYTVEFWADILGNYPELMDKIPAGTIPVVWQYDSPSLMKAALAAMTQEERDGFTAHGVDIDALTNGFVDRAKALIGAGKPFWVAPGTSTWLSILGRLDNAIENMVDAAEVGLAHGSTGYLNTAWGDNGMYDPPAISYGPVVFGGAVSWSLEANRDLDLAEVLSTRVFDDETGQLGRLLVEFGEVAARLDVPMLNASPLFRVLLDAGVLEPHLTPGPAALASARATLESGLADLVLARPAAPGTATVVAEITQAVRLALFAVSLLESGLLARVAADTAEGRISDSAEARTLLATLDLLLDSQRTAWLVSSRPGGLSTSIGRLDPLRRALIERAGY